MVTLWCLEHPSTTCWNFLGLGESTVGAKCGKVYLFGSQELSFWMLKWFLNILFCLLPWGYIALLPPMLAYQPLKTLGLMVAYGTVHRKSWWQRGVHRRWLLMGGDANNAIDLDTSYVIFLKFTSPGLQGFKVWAVQNSMMDFRKFSIQFPYLAHDTMQAWAHLV